MITYPFVPLGKTYKYVEMANPFMQAAMTETEKHAEEWGSTVGVAFVKNDKVLVVGANGTDFHKKFGCKRKQLGIHGGQGYELCPGCDYANHSEPKAVRKAQAEGIDLNGADAYLFGQWWCCEPCSKAMLAAGINEIYLLKGSEVFFNRGNPESKSGDFAYFKKLLSFPT